MMVASAVKDRLKVGGEGHWEKGKGERGEEKNERGESLIKQVINGRGTLYPETIGRGVSSISNDGSHPYLLSSIPLWVD